MQTQLVRCQQQGRRGLQHLQVEKAQLLLLLLLLLPPPLGLSSLVQQEVVMQQHLQQQLLPLSLLPLMKETLLIQNSWQLCLRTSDRRSWHSRQQSDGLALLLPGRQQSGSRK
jgi:hypothetical protein